MPVQAPMDAIALATRIYGELPDGSTRNYATMVIMNSLASYSDEHGLQLEQDDRGAIKPLSLEYLYLAWLYDTEIKLDQSQAQDWPHQIWKDSSNLGINLKELIETKVGDREKLRQAQTLLSFASVVKQYFSILQTQKDGLQTFKNSYCPIVPCATSLSDCPDTQPSDSKSSKPGWSWTNLWGGYNSDSAESMLLSPTLEPLAIPGSMPPPPIDPLPLATLDTKCTHSNTESSPSASAGSSTSRFPASASSNSSLTTESIADSAVSAMDQLEAYLILIGASHCKDVGRMKSEKNPTPLKKDEEIAESLGPQQPALNSSREPECDPILANWKDPSSINSNKCTTLRWMTGEELRMRQAELDAQKAQQNTKKAKKTTCKGTKAARIASQKASPVRSRAEKSSLVLAKEEKEAQVIHVVGSD